jgi:hypothetical protein
LRAFLTMLFFFFGYRIQSLFTTQFDEKHEKTNGCGCFKMTNNLHSLLLDPQYSPVVLSCFFSSIIHGLTFPILTPRINKLINLFNQQNNSYLVVHLLPKLYYWTKSKIFFKRVFKQREKLLFFSFPFSLLLYCR